MFRTGGTYMRKAKKAAALLFSFVFFVSFVLSDASAVVDVAPMPYDMSAPVPTVFAPLKMDNFSLPAHLGEIKLKNQGAGDKFVIHIQDAHCNKYAQVKIADTIDYLTEEYGISVVNLEGGVGGYDLDIFTSITGDAIRREVALHFVKTGEINGAEFFAVNNPGRVKLWGIEDKDLYLANLKIYRDSLLYKEDVNKYLGEIQHVVSNLKRHMFSRDLFELHNAYTSYKAGDTEFKEYLSFIVRVAKSAGISIKQFENVFKLKRTIDMEADIDFKKANKERDLLVDELKKRLSKQETRELMSKTLAFKTKRISRKSFYDYLLYKARVLGLDSHEFTELSDYIIYVTTYEGINRFKVIDELDDLEKEIKEPLFTDAGQRELDVLDKNLTLTKNIFEVSLTKKDYKYYLFNKDSFAVNKYRYFFEEYAPKYKVEAKLSKNITDLDTYLDNIGGFFEYSFLRDEAFMRNMKYTRTSDGKEIAIVLMGGFHTENFCQMMEEKNISYVSILPNFKSGKDYKNPYFDILAGQTTDVQKMIATVLAKTSMIQVASMLNSVLGKAVWGELGIDSFAAAVALRVLAARGIKVDIVDADGKVIGAPRYEDVSEAYRKADAVGITRETLVNMLKNESLIDPEIQAAWEDTISGKAKRAFTFEEMADQFASDGKNSRELAVEYLEEQAYSLKEAGEADAARNLAIVAAGLRTAPIDLLTGVEGFMAHAGGMGIHVSLDAVLAANGVTLEDGSINGDRAAKVIAALLIHEAFAGHGYDHAFSETMERRFTGQLDSDVTSGEAGDIAGSANVDPVWRVAEVDRWKYERDVAAGLKELIRNRLFGSKEVASRMDVQEAFFDKVSLEESPFAGSKTYGKMMKELQELEAIIPQDVEQISTLTDEKGALLKVHDISGKLLEANRRVIYQQGSKDLEVSGLIVLEEKVGEGGMGEVYRGTKTEYVKTEQGDIRPVTTKVAVKFLLDASDPKVLQTFFQEYKRGALGMHGVVKALDIGKITVLDANGENSGLEKYYMVQEWAGEDVMDNIGKVTTENLIIGGLTGLAEMHDRGDIHNDVKLPNFMIQEGSVTLADLGMVIRLEAGAEEVKLETYVGTPEFSPTQVIATYLFSKRSDLFGMAESVFVQHFGALLGGLMPDTIDSGHVKEWLEARENGIDLDPETNEFAKWAQARESQIESIGMFTDDPFMQFLYNMFTSSDTTPDGEYYENPEGYKDAHDALEAYLRLPSKMKDWYVGEEVTYETFEDSGHVYADIKARIDDGFNNGEFRIRPGDVLFDSGGSAWQFKNYEQPIVDDSGNLQWSIRFVYYGVGQAEPYEVVSTVEEVMDMFTGARERVQAEQLYFTGAGREFAHHLDGNLREQIRSSIKSQILALKERGSVRRDVLTTISRQKELVKRESKIDRQDMYDVTPDSEGIAAIQAGIDNFTIGEGYLLLDVEKNLWEILRIEGEQVWLRQEIDGVVSQDPNINGIPNSSMSDLRATLVARQYSKIKAPLKDNPEAIQLLNTISSKNLAPDEVAEIISKNEIKDEAKKKQLAEKYSAAFNSAQEMFYFYQKDISDRLRTMLGQKLDNDQEIDAELERQMGIVWSALTDPASNFDKWFTAHVDVNEGGEVEYVLGERNALAENVMSFLQSQDPDGKKFLLAEYILHEALEKTDLIHPEIIFITTVLVFDRRGENPLGDVLRDFIDSAAEVKQATKSSRELMDLALQGEQANVQLVEISEEQMVNLSNPMNKEKRDIRRTMEKKFGNNLTVIFFTRSNLSEAIESAKKLSSAKNSRVLAFVGEDFRGAKIVDDKTGMDLMEEAFSRGEGEYGNTLVGVIPGNFVSDNMNERFSTVFLSVFGAGLMERDRAHAMKDELKARQIESKLKKMFGEIANVSIENAAKTPKELLDALVNGDILMEMKKIDYEEIRDYMRSESEVLRSL